MAIELKEALQQLESGDWCRIRYITADFKKGTGGKVVELSKCRIARRRQPAATAAGLDKSSTSHTKQRVTDHNKHFLLPRFVSPRTGTIELLTTYNRCHHCDS